MKNTVTYEVYITSNYLLTSEKIAEFTDKDTALQYAYDCIHGEHADDYDWYVDDHNEKLREEGETDEVFCEFYVEAHEHYDIYDYLQEEWLDNEIVAYIEQN